MLVTVALANRTARIAWALMTNEEVALYRRRQDRLPPGMENHAGHRATIRDATRARLFAEPLISDNLALAVH